MTGFCSWTTRLATLAFSMAVFSAHAAVRTRTFDYMEGTTVLEGYIAWDDAKTGKRPGVVVYPQWTGPSDHERGAAVDLAKLGYVAMVADIYGKGIHPAAPKDAGVMMGKFLNDRALLRSRVKAGYDRLLRDPHVDSTRIAATGYCFGGAAVLELGRQGASVAALVSFHGDLSNPTPADAKNIKAHVLILHGADDPVVPPSEVDAFKAEMKAAGTDWFSSRTAARGTALPCVRPEPTTRSRRLTIRCRHGGPGWLCETSCRHPLPSRESSGAITLA